MAARKKSFLSDEVPQFLHGGRQLGATVIFTSVFILAVTLAVLPLTLNFWIISTGVILVSKIFFRAIRREHTRWAGFVLWNLMEVLIIACVYCLVESGDYHILLKAAGCAFGCLAICYVIAAQFFAIGEMSNTIRVMDFGAVTTDTPVSSIREEKITLCDNNGALKLVVSIQNLWYIESDDNYIKVWYDDAEGTLKQYMLRCRLKTVEESFSGSALVRCHRKYIVNLMKVETMSKTKDGYSIKLGHEKIAAIPVSKTYENNLLARFNSR